MGTVTALGNHTRYAAHAGSFYPAEKNEINKLFTRFFHWTQKAGSEKPIAVIVPHAGYIYSGQTAAYAYNLLKGNGYKRVVLLAPSHYAYLRGVIVNEKSYQTPLGIYPADTEAFRLLQKESLPFSRNEIAEINEHSDEVQVPFLQTVLPDSKLITILVGEMDPQELLNTAMAISKIIDDDTVLVVSSDFTHYGRHFDYTPKINGKLPKEVIEEIDKSAIDTIVKGDLSGFDKVLKETRATICGQNPIRLLLKILEVMGREYDGKLLSYTESGEMTGSYDTSVSYAAIAFFQNSSEAEKKRKPDLEERLINIEEEMILLKLSRFVLTGFIKDGSDYYPPESLSRFQLTPALMQDLGVFVTLKMSGNLRGCIGYIEGRGPLFESVIENTMNAAAFDPRFRKVTAAELDLIDIEISVMTPLVKIKNPDEIVIGRDGLYLVNGRNSSVFLPQVPLEWGWNLNTYLEELCGKAGLPSEIYKERSTDLYRFSAQVFGEK